jgi:hypothetical protein
MIDQQEKKIREVFTYTTESKIDKQTQKIKDVLTGTKDGFETYPPIDKNDVTILRQVKTMDKMRIIVVRNLRSKKFLKQGGIKKF